MVNEVHHQCVVYMAGLTFNWCQALSDMGKTRFPEPQHIQQQPAMVCIIIIIIRGFIPP